MTYKLAALRFRSVGERSARFQDLTLTFSAPADGGSEPQDSVIWLRNGGGKSSILSLLYALLLPRAADFMGRSVKRSLTDYIDGGDTAHVVAVEPHPGNFELLRQNLSPYAPRVTLIQGAIWKSGGHLDLDLGQEEWRTSVRASSDGRSGSVEAFPLTALLAHGNGKVDLLKLDIEGSESEVFGPEAQEWLPTIRNIAIRAVIFCRPIKPILPTLRSS